MDKLLRYISLFHASDSFAKECQLACNEKITLLAFLSETPKRFRLMLSSMSASAAIAKLFFFNISETIRASDFNIYHKVALDSLYISTGNDVINSEANSTNM